MIKIFVTGDNHFGKKYDRYPQIRDQLLESRFVCLENMVKEAEKQGCGLFVVTGDLFDSINGIKVADVKRVVNILAGFGGSVIVLPGNHDYYTGEEKVWNDFHKALSSVDHNITLITEYRKYEFEQGEDKVVVYPAFCDSKHAKENKLGWIKAEDISKDGVINIGIAHGALKGITPDMKEEYFLMTEKELISIPVDVWLIGHTHIPYPAELSADEDTYSYRIFNAGTHEQTDLHNNTAGYGFIITIEKNGVESKVAARKYVSGRIRYYDLTVKVAPDSETALSDAISKAVEGIAENSIVRVKVSGSVKQFEYQERGKIYKDHLEKYLTYEVEDAELSEEITMDVIQTEYAETSLASRLLAELMDNSTELQMAYDLLKECRE